MIETPAFIISIQSKRPNRVDVTLLKSQDSEKSDFFIYSIYGYKNSSLPDISKMRHLVSSGPDVKTGAGREAEAVWRVGALFCPPGRRGSRACSASRFLMQQTQAQTPAYKHIWMKKRRPVAGEVLNYCAASSSCTTRAKVGGRKGAEVGLIIVGKVELITAHNPFVLLRVICLLSK